MTLADILAAVDQQAEREPERFALVETTGTRVTYRELHDLTVHVAANLRAAGFQRGDHVIFMVQPRIESIVLILAIMRLGGVLVAVDPTAGDALFASRLARVTPRWMIAESFLWALACPRPVRAALRRRGVALPNLRQHLGSVCTPVFVGPWLPGVPKGAMGYERLYLPSPPASHSTGTGEVGAHSNAPNCAATEHDPAVIVFTSGTTALPKAVVHTGASIGATMAMLGKHLALTPQDVVYASEMHLILPALMAGALSVLPRARKFAPAAFVADITRYRVTHTFAVPSDFEGVIAYLSAQQAQLPGHLRTLLFGSASVERPFLVRCQVALAPETTAWAVYAMTEMLPVSAATLDAKLSYTGDGDYIGAPFPGVCATVAGGELVLAGPNLCQGYLGESPMTEHRTGDLARIDTEGRIVLLGRTKEMIIRGHTNIYPALIEETVNRIAGVRTSALVGRYDPERSDERVVLVVEPFANESETVLRTRLERELRAGPHSIDTTAYPDEIVFAPLPRAGRSHKVDRQALAALVERSGG
jgi:long-chain acyl-CoA synthetase